MGDCVERSAARVAIGATVGERNLVRIIQHVLRRNALVGKVNAIGVRLKSIQSDISVSGGCPFVLIDKGSPLIYDIQRRASGGSIM